MEDSKQKIAVIIGAGPAGLTAAYELVQRTDIKPIIIEITNDIGGLSKTVDYKGNKIDIGGHRFFSKSDKVLKWWNEILSVEDVNEQPVGIGSNNKHNDKTMLVRNRKSRILFAGKLFDYPIQLNADTFFNLGFKRIAKIIISHMRAKLFPIKPEASLEDLFINRFGRVLYEIFFKSYTEKVWGVSCKKLSSDWGAQRIKGLSLTKAVFAALKTAIIHPTVKNISQKNTETSLIQKFLYPKYGPGQMWTEVARVILEKGGIILFNHQPISLSHSGNRISEARVKENSTGKEQMVRCDYFFSSMPIKELASIMLPHPPQEVLRLSNSLAYRDFIIVGLLLRKIKLTDRESSNGRISDNWLYIQEPDVKIGRIQIFNNWSPYLVADRNTMWIGAEYFANEGDEMWSKTNEELKCFVAKELSAINFIDASDVIDGVSLKLPKAYPVYSGEYDHFDRIREYVDLFENLFLVGRNGMHKYNSQDHSMLTAITAVDNIINGIKTKENIWSVDTEEKYREDWK